jgi:hypothetical protein
MRNWTKLLRGAVIFGTVLLITSPAHANAMIPVIVIGWFGMFVALVPIVLIESFVLARTGVGIWDSSLAMSAANLGSTLAGIPLAIVLEIVVAMTTPLYKGTWNPKDTWFREWMLPAGAVALLIPFFLMSWWIETRIAALILEDLSAQFVDTAVRNANLTTYGVLAALLSVVFVRGMLSTMWRKRRIRNRRLPNASATGKIMASEPADSWKFGNERAKIGIASLKAAETRIHRRQLIHLVADVRRFDDTSGEKAA